jgi:hypothetical protein
LDAFAWLSMSIRSVRFPLCATPAANEMDVVVFPVPPFWDATAMIIVVNFGKAIKGLLQSWFLQDNQSDARLSTGEIEFSLHQPYKSHEANRQLERKRPPYPASFHTDCAGCQDHL